MSTDTFAHHTADRNDFANWIEHVIEDKKLAHVVRKLNGKAAITKAVQVKLSYNSIFGRKS